MKCVMTNPPEATYAIQCNLSSKITATARHNQKNHNAIFIPLVPV